MNQNPGAPDRQRLLEEPKMTSAQFLGGDIDGPIALVLQARSLLAQIDQILETFAGFQSLCHLGAQRLKGRDGLGDLIGPLVREAIELSIGKNASSGGALHRIIDAFLNIKNDVSS